MQVKSSLTSSLWVTGRMVSMSSDLGGLPRSWLWLWDARGGGFPSSLRTWRSPLAVAPALSFRTGLVSHFFSVLTERLDPGELGAELPDACGGSDTTEVEMLPSLPAAEYESGDGEGEKGEKSSEMAQCGSVELTREDSKSSKVQRLVDVGGKNGRQFVDKFNCRIFVGCVIASVFSWCGKTIIS